MSQHPGARERAFEELFRRPQPAQAQAQRHPHSSSHPSHRYPQQPQQQQQQQQQQQGYYPQHSYPDYAQFGLPTPVAAQPGAGAQGPPASSGQQGGYGGQRTASMSSYRTAGQGGADPGSMGSQRASYFDSGYPNTSAAATYVQSASKSYTQRSYSSAQAYQDYGTYPTQQPAVQGYYPHDDPSPPPPPPGASRSAYASPRAQYAPTMSSGPPSASTSTSLFSRPSTSSVSSLPYSLPEPGSNGSDSPANSSSFSPNMSPATNHVGLPPAGAAGSGFSGSAAPPRLPEIAPSVGGNDDFFGNWQEQQKAQQAGYADASWRSSMAGGVTPTAGTYGKRGSPASAAEVDGYDGASMANYPSAESAVYGNPAFDRSRRSSADSDLRSVYQQASQPTTLLPINPSLVSLQQYPYGNGTPFATQSSVALHPRKSSESMRVMPTQPKHNSAGYAADRALSFSSGERPDLYFAGAGGQMGPYGSASAFAASQPHLPTQRPPSHGSLPPNFTVSGPTSSSTPTSSQHPAAPRQRAPVVYPALLSRVAAAFKDRIALAERIKDGLVYQDAFDGRDAVDKIAYIIKTSDRNLALLLGRALDAQKFFHDVTYDHRLRDSPNEIYQFRERIAASLPFLQGADDDLVPSDQNQIAQTPHAPHSAAARAQAAGQAAAAASADPRRGSTASAVTTGAGGAAAAQEDPDELPSGVFTLLTDCYSPTCTRDRLCYSIACPRRLEQQARLNLKREGLNSGLESVGAGAGGLKRSNSIESIAEREPGSLWIHSVPQEVLDSTSDTEKKRQEAINEVFYTERDFVRDMEYLRDFWIKPLRSSNVIPEARREDFVTQVFWNVLEIYAVNVRLSELLNKRQKQAHVVDHIGDIFLDMVPHFAPFVKYGAHQLYGKYEFEKEKGSNPAFAKFVDETERLPESRKLELNGYLTKPTTRLARYPLLLDACLKHTADDNPDKVAIPKVIKLIREFLTKVNVETGKSENRFNLAQLDQQLVFKNGEAVDLRLRDEERELIFKGPLKKRGGTQSESAELQVFLFDHAVLMVKQKSKNEQYKVYRKPIPLELLVVAPVDAPPPPPGGGPPPHPPKPPRPPPPQIVTPAPANHPPPR
ncbi:hypothetical protein JCM8097_000722, partial [Rhodosporidiobolus ruineniae]